ncbi:F-box protein CPR1-like [Beta vulgaris subsp. vulgaris]|uniref:F-box protein CPR1-like n=1 Tax=Beta vulgaris subsp. vulgaris TaxID=3555 RepID=UPI002546B250|nr:F-box protein CPR1-like [Beta vulgaris subsp. vulgaris]
MATLPYDIIMREILPKLPAESLLLFKSVSKSFKTVISSLEFINLHLQHGLSNTSNRFLIHVHKHGAGDFICVNMDSIKSPLYSTFDSIHLYYCYLGRTPVITVGSCNGLLCMSNALLPIFMVLNPCTGMSLNIPYPIRYTFFMRIGSFYSGFGFDSIDNDYKIVLVLDYHYAQEEGGFMINRDVLVYSLKNNASKSWRLVHSISSPKESMIMIDHRTQHHYRKGVLINNHLLHWNFNHSPNEYRIACFDLESENWVKDVPLPEYYRETMKKKRIKDYLHSLREKGIQNVFSVFLQKENSINCYDLWVMKEYGVKESWVKLFQILDPYVSDMDWKLYFLGYHGSGKNDILVMRVNNICDTTHLLSYNVQDKSLTILDQSDEVRYLLDVFSYPGSLVELPGGQRIGN